MRGRLRPSRRAIEAPSGRSRGRRRSVQPPPLSSCKWVQLPPNGRAMAPQDITKLIVRTSMKDRAAFDLLYRQTSAKLFGVCLRVLNDRAEAEEALQEVYVK